MADEDNSDRSDVPRGGATAQERVRRLIAQAKAKLADDDKDS